MMYIFQKEENFVYQLIKLKKLSTAIIDEKHYILLIKSVTLAAFINLFNKVREIRNKPI